MGSGSLTVTQHSLACVFLIAISFSAWPQRAVGQSASSTTAYLGFDRNDYPGDENLAALHHAFAYSGYWLNNPPGATSNSWVGKRSQLRSAGLGFLVLFNGQLEAVLKNEYFAARLGKVDGLRSVAAAKREGFAANTIIFLDQEEGGRMLPQQKAYIYAWADAVNAGGFRAGVYCSGIAFQETPAVNIVTANDIRDNAAGRKIVFWVTNDACPPSPGCSFPKSAPAPSLSGSDFAEVWQFAQSPRRKNVAHGCPANPNADGNCYPPALDPAKHLYIDLDSATSADPSHGRD